VARASDFIIGSRALPVDGELPAYPEIVAGFEALGFRRIGGLQSDLTEAQLDDLFADYEPRVQAEMRRASARAEAVLSAPDGAAFVGIEWFYGMPSVRLRSALEDRRLVETQRAWDRLPDRPLSLAKYARHFRLRPEQDKSARGRLVTLVATDDPAVLWSAHRDAVGLAGSAPVEHQTIEQAQALWSASHAHEIRIAMRVGPVLKVALYAVQVVGLTLAALFVLLDRLVEGFAVCVLGVVAALVLGFRAAWWLRYVRWIRPRFRAP
jgi:hypothetical protein